MRGRCVARILIDPTPVDLSQRAKRIGQRAYSRVAFDCGRDGSTEASTDLGRGHQNVIVADRGVAVTALLLALEGGVTTLPDLV